MDGLADGACGFALVRRFHRSYHAVFGYEITAGGWGAQGKEVGKMRHNESGHWPKSEERQAIGVWCMGLCAGNLGQL